MGGVSVIKTYIVVKTAKQCRIKREVGVFISPNRVATMSSVKFGISTTILVRNYETKKFEHTEVLTAMRESLS